MTSINGKIICGARSGTDFWRQKRVDRYSNQCPEGYSKCSNETSESETVCISEKRYKEFECPILDLVIINEAYAPTWQSQGYQIAAGSFYDHHNTKVKIAYSK